MSNHTDSWIEKHKCNKEDSKYPSDECPLCNREVKGSFTSVSVNAPKIRKMLEGMSREELIDWDERYWIGHTHNKGLFEELQEYSRAEENYKEKYYKELEQNELLSRIISIRLGNKGTIVYSTINGQIKYPFKMLTSINKHPEHPDTMVIKWYS